jgi:hypothetical protein
LSRAADRSSRAHPRARYWPGVPGYAQRWQGDEPPQRQTYHTTGIRLKKGVNTILIKGERIDFEPRLLAIGAIPTWDQNPMWALTWAADVHEVPLPNSVLVADRKQRIEGRGRNLVRNPC